MHIRPTRRRSKRLQPTSHKDAVGMIKFIAVWILICILCMFIGIALDAY